MTRFLKASQRHKLSDKRESKKKVWATYKELENVTKHPLYSISHSKTPAKWPYVNYPLRMSD